MRTLFENNMDMWQPDMMDVDDVYYGGGEPRYLNLSTIDGWIVKEEKVKPKYRLDVSYDVRYKLSNGKIAEADLTLHIPIVMIGEEIGESEKWENRLTIELAGGHIFSTEFDVYTHNWKKEKNRIKGRLDHHLGFNRWIKFPVDLKEDIITRVMNFLDTFDEELDTLFK